MISSVSTNLYYKAMPIKKSLDKDAPTTARKPNAYLYFLKNNMAEVKKNNPELIPTDVMKKIGHMWTGLNESQKNEYIELNLKFVRPFLSTVFFQVEDQNGCRNPRVDLPSLKAFAHLAWRETRHK